MAAAARGSTTPPPVIGKMGRYTVFMTPSSTPKPSAADNAAAEYPKVVSPPAVQPPPVQPPPQQFEKLPSKSNKSSVPGFGFFWNTLAKVQGAHSSLDDYLAEWFGLNQSKYQWALNDYLESKEMDKAIGKSKDFGSKV